MFFVSKSSNDFTRDYVQNMILFIPGLKRKRNGTLLKGWLKRHYLIKFYHLTDAETKT